MAAIGGDTIVPTNWSGLLITAAVIAVIAAATYFGLESQFGGEAPPATKDGVSVQEVFSANSQREVAQAKAARALPRAAVAPSPERSPAATSPEPQTTPAATPAPTVRPTPAPRTTPAPATDPAPAATSAPSPASPQPAASAATQSAAAPAHPSAEALQAWWLDAGEGLGVRFVGPLDQGQKRSDAVAIMFSEPVSPQTANAMIKLRDASGTAVTPAWKAGRNPALIYLDGLASGRYRVVLSSGITGRDGTRLERELSGPVFLQ